MRGRVVLYKFTSMSEEYTASIFMEYYNKRNTFLRNVGSFLTTRRHIPEATIYFTSDMKFTLQGSQMYVQWLKNERPT